MESDKYICVRELPEAGQGGNVVIIDIEKPNRYVVFLSIFDSRAVAIAGVPVTWEKLVAVVSLSPKPRFYLQLCFERITCVFSCDKPSCS